MTGTISNQDWLVKLNENSIENLLENDERMEENVVDVVGSRASVREREREGMVRFLEGAEQEQPREESAKP